MVDRHTFGQRLSWRPSWRIAEAPLLFVDLETTGLYPDRGHRILQAAIFDGGGLRYQRGNLSPGDKLDEERAIVGDVAQTVRDNIVVGHNISFDIGFLAERCRRLEFAPPSMGFVDTLGLARRFLDDVDDALTLEYVAGRLDVDMPDQFHRAAPDARVARDVFYELTERQGFETLKDVRVRRFRAHDH